jgi:hypothetical protein
MYASWTVPVLNCLASARAGGCRRKPRTGSFHRGSPRKPGAGAPTPEALRELVNECSRYYKHVKTQAGTSDVGLQRFTFMTTLAGAIRQPPALDVEPGGKKEVLSSMRTMLLASLLGLPGLAVLVGNHGKLRTAMGCDDDRLQRRTEPGGWVLTTAGVRLNDEGKGQIDGAKVFGRSCTAEAAGKLVSAAHGFTGTRQNDSVSRSKGSSGECRLSLIAKGCCIADVGIVRDVTISSKTCAHRKGPVFRAVKVMDWRASQGPLPRGPAGTPMADYPPFPLIKLSGGPRERVRRFMAYSLAPDRTAQRQPAG